MKRLNKNLIHFFTITVLMMTSVTVYAHGAVSGNSWGDHYSMMGGGLGFAIYGLGMLIFWGVIIYAGVWFIRDLIIGKESKRLKNPLGVLNHRLASGEIDQAEYTELKKELEK